ncbi:MAG: helix-turn-helix transcriptional regulator [Neisseriaceae bacterium]|nr:helix-turn-helix transcriptional regulator [Neisseriaceae bacterium]MBP6861731.1 helix-turn-helix transcriptional regulator [Neisseriaceae bacterium]
MNSHKKSVDRNDYQHIPQLIGAMPKEFVKGFHNLPHAHERVQLIYASAGIMEVKTAERQWILSPETALLIPKNLLHEMTALSTISLRTLFIHPKALSGHQSEQVQFIKVNSFLKELIIKAASLPMAYDEHGIEAKLMDLILFELRHHQSNHFVLPNTHDKKLLLIEQRMMDDYALLAESIHYWAKTLHCSTKTLNRLTHKEIGISFQLWKQYIMIKISLILMAQQRSLTQIAYDLGYASLPSFSRMFKKITGKSPSDFTINV